MGWTFESPEDGQPPNLSRIRLADSRLINARFRRIDVSHGDFTGADLTRAELWGNRARSACFRNADLTGICFRGLDLTEADLRARNYYRTQLLACILD